MNKINVGQELQKTTPTTFWQRRSVFERDFFNFFIIVGASVAAAVCILFILTGGIAGIVFGVAKILVLFGLNNSIFPGVFSFFAYIIGKVLQLACPVGTSSQQVFSVSMEKNFCKREKQEEWEVLGGARQFCTICFLFYLWLLLVQ